MDGPICLPLRLTFTSFGQLLSNIDWTLLSSWAFSIARPRFSYAHWWISATVIEFLPFLQSWIKHVFVLARLCSLGCSTLLLDWALLIDKIANLYSCTNDWCLMHYGLSALAVHRIWTIEKLNLLSLNSKSCKINLKWIITKKRNLMISRVFQQA